MRKCYSCKETKPLTEFYKDSHKKNGYQYECKTCTKKYIKNYKRKNPKYRKSQQNITIKWIKNNKEISQKYVKEWQNKNPEKVKAHSIAQKQQIIDTCYFCLNDKKLLRHHPNYNKPELIVILCYSCHRKLHIILKVSIS